jgi:hypothetical protein
MQLNEVKKVISGPVQNDVHTQREKGVKNMLGSLVEEGGVGELFFACVLHETGETWQKVRICSQCTPGRLTKVRARDSGLVY